MEQEFLLSIKCNQRWYSSKKELHKIKFSMAKNTDELRMVLMRGLMLVIKIILLYHVGFTNIWDKRFKNGPSKICGRQPLKYLKEYSLL